MFYYIGSMMSFDDAPEPFFPSCREKLESQRLSQACSSCFLLKKQKKHNPFKIDLVLSGQALPLLAKSLLG